MQDDTREQLLTAAKRQFAAKGFYGASIALVAGEVGLTKQALLYHFKRKEDLYAEVLQTISQRLLRFVQASGTCGDPPETKLEDILLGLYHASREYPMDTQILVRELLDNPSRSEQVKDWYLRPFLDEIVAVLRRIDGFERLTTATVFCMVYQVLGSIEYFSISTATLRRMYGETAYNRIVEDFPRELRHRIRRLIAEQALPLDTATPAAPLPTANDEAPAASD